METWYSFLWRCRLFFIWCDYHHRSVRLSLSLIIKDVVDVSSSAKRHFRFAANARTLHTHQCKFANLIYLQEKCNHNFVCTFHDDSFLLFGSLLLDSFYSTLYSTPWKYVAPFFVHFVCMRALLFVHIHSFWSEIATKKQHKSEEKKKKMWKCMVKVRI